jgi:hypothetical protein
MNDLIISVAKERILPLSTHFIDYPNEQFESQLYKIATYITRAILDAYVVISNWSFVVTEQSKLTLALKTVFPREWLQVADTSPHYHLQLHKLIHQYKFTLGSESIERIHRIVEFLCYELIETTVIYSNFRRISELEPENLQIAVDGDSILKQILVQNNIHVTGAIRLNHSMLEITGVEVSNKAQRLLRVYIEELIQGVLESRQNFDVLVMDDIERYFKRVSITNK